MTGATLPAGLPTSPPLTDPSDVVLGCALIFVGQAFSGINYVWTEKVMKNTSITPLFLVGVEGVVGAALLLLLGYPILGAVPGSDYGGCQESLADTLAMLRNSELLQKFLACYMVGVFFLNVWAVTCTKYLTSVVTALVINGLRTAFVGNFHIIK